MSSFGEYINRKGRACSYKSSEDICVNCGQRGGSHCSDVDGVSWCYNTSTRAREKNPMFHTYFSYSKMNNNNPNKTFIKEV